MASGRFRIGVMVGCALVVLWNQSAASVQDRQWAISEGLVKERVIGLLSLPEIVGPECAPTEPSRANLYGGPSKGRSAIGWIESSQDEHCQLWVRRAENNSAEQLPADESGYETTAAIVYQRVSRWFRIALQHGSAWITRDNPNDFLSYPELLTNRLTYLREEWDGRLWGTPRASVTMPVSSTWKSYAKQKIPLTFLGVRRLGTDPWIQVRLETESCGESMEGVTPVEGWLPAYRPSGMTSVWFYSRGC